MTTLIHPENIPQELKDRPQWVTWKFADGTKVPCSTATGKIADAHSPASWGTFDQAVHAYQYRHHAGIGYVFTKNDPYVGVDLDDCVENGVVVQEDAAIIIGELPTYTEISPSGRGVKLWVRAELAASLKTSTPSGLKLEVYPDRRFFTVTGNRLDATPGDIHEHSVALNAICDGLRPKANAHVKRPIASAPIDSDHARRWCLAALEGERAKMEAAGDNQRHHRRLASARALGGLVHTGAVTEQEIFDALAVNFGANQKVAEKTIWDGITYGKEHPRDVPVKQEPTFDADGYVYCPTHGQRLIACRNGNGYRCAAPKLGEPLCFWWKGEGYTNPSEQVDPDDLDILDDVDTLRQRLRAAIAERDRYRQEAEQLRLELGEVKKQNRFVTQAAGAKGIGSPSMRLTVMELKKELDRVPVEERDPEQFVRVRPAYMAECVGQNRSTISRHLGELESAGYIEKKVEKSYNPETRSWCSETFVRPLVDLSDPTQVVMPAKPRGKQACAKCHSENLKRRTVTKCEDCGHEEWSDWESINTSESELQTAQPEEETTQNAIEFFESLPDEVEEGVECNAPHNKKTAVFVAELQNAQTPLTLPSAPELQTAQPVPDVSTLTQKPTLHAARLTFYESMKAKDYDSAGKAIAPFPQLTEERQRLAEVRGVTP